MFHCTAAAKSIHVTEQLQKRGAKICYHKFLMRRDCVTEFDHRNSNLPSVTEERQAYKYRKKAPD